MQQERPLTDQDVLDVLRVWLFKANKTRANVLPQGTTFVHSDMLGVVRSRTGKVVATKFTLKYTAVFQLLCRWLRQNCTFHPAFAFTSTNVNFGYAARRHRDSDSDPSCVVGVLLNHVQPLPI